MDPEDGRRESFLQHLDESEHRLGARRQSVLDALFIGLIALVIAGGLAAGIVRLRTIPNGSDQARPVAPPAARIAVPNETSATPSASPPGIRPSDKDDRPYVDASKPGTYTLKDPRVEVQIHTLSEKERDQKLEQLKKEGLLTDREIQELKAQTRSRR
jgi:hypothetical protein